MIVGVKVAERELSAKALVKQTSVLELENLGVQLVESASLKTTVMVETDKSFGKKVPVNVKLSPPRTFNDVVGVTAVIVQAMDSAVRPEVGMYPRVA